MRYKFVTTLFIAIHLLITGLHAQDEIPSKKEAEAARGRAVIVQIEVPNSKTVTRLQKKGHIESIEIYLKALEKYNLTMESVVKKYWKFSDKILYKTPDEIAALIDSKSTEYLILRCASTTIGTGLIKNSTASRDPSGNHLAAVTNFGGNLDWSYTELKKKEWEDDRDYWNGNTVMELWRIEKLEKNFMKTPDVVCRLGLPEIFPDTASAVFGCCMIQDKLAQALPHEKTVTATQQLKDDYSSLKSKTVWVRKDRLDPELTPAAIKALYSGPVNIVSNADYQSAIMKGEENNVFILVAPLVVTIDYGVPSGGQVMYYNFVFDAAQGRTIAAVAPPVGAIYKMGFLGGNAGKPVANEHTFKFLGSMLKAYAK